MGRAIVKEVGQFENPVVPIPARSGHHSPFALEQPFDSCMPESAGQHPVERAVARAFGHAAATAHMADHAMGVPIYLAKAFKASGLDGGLERARELELLKALPEALGQIVAEILYEKENPAARARR